MTGSLLLEEESENRREGFWKLPALENEAAFERLPVILKSRYSITHHRVTLFVHGAAGDGREGTGPRNARRWFGPDEVERLPMRSPYRKALVALSQSAPPPCHRSL